MIQKRVYLHSGQITVNICEIRGSFLRGQLQYGTPPRLKQVAIVVAGQIARCYLEPKTFTAFAPALLLQVPASTPHPCLRLGTANITISENLRGTRWGAFLCVLSSYHDDRQQRRSACPLWVHFLLFLLVQFAFLNFWPQRGKYNGQALHRVSEFT